MLSHELDYRFSRASDGVEFGRATMVQVTITPEHTAERIAPDLRERLEALGSGGRSVGDREPERIDPRSPSKTRSRSSSRVDLREDAVAVAYEFRRAGTEAVCIRAAIAYGCFDAAGMGTPFPPATIEAVTDG